MMFMKKKNFCLVYLTYNATIIGDKFWFSNYTVALELSFCCYLYPELYYIKLKNKAILTWAVLSMMYHTTVTWPYEKVDVSSQRSFTTSLMWQETQTLLCKKFWKIFFYICTFVFWFEEKICKTIFLILRVMELLAHH